MSGFTYLMATNGKAELYVRCTEKHIVEVTDKLFDRGYKVGQCAAWFYWKNVDNNNCYEFDDDDEINFEP